MSSNWWLLFECIYMRNLVHNGRGNVKEDSLEQDEVERKELGIVKHFITTSCDDIFRTVMEMAKDNSNVAMHYSLSDSSDFDDDVEDDNDN